MSANLLLRAILARPNDLAPRKVLADVLLDQDDPRGEFIALQCEISEHEDEAMRARAEELLFRHERAWSAEVRQIGPLGFSPEGPGPAFARFGFRRGFVEDVRMTGRDFLAHASALAEVTPLTGVSLTELYAGELEAIADLSLLRPLRRLSLRFADAENDADRALEALLRSSCLGQLEQLEIIGGLGERGAAAMAGCGALEAAEELSLRFSSRGARLGPSGARLLGRLRAPKLRGLAVCGHAIGAAGVEAIASAAFAPGIERLDLSGNDLGAGGAELFARAWPAGRLGRLVWRRNGLGLRGARALAGAEVLGKVRELELGEGNRLGVPGLEAFLGALRGCELESLGLSACGLSQGGARALLSSELLGGLRRLDLSRNPLGAAALRSLSTRSFPRLSELSLAGCACREEGVAALAQGSLLASVRFLDLAHNRLGSAGCRTLARSDNLTHLQSLSIDGNWVGVQGVRALLAAPTLRSLRRLDLGRNNFGSEGIAALTRSSVVGGLEVLRTSNVDAAAVEALAASGVAAGLRELHISHSALWEEGALALSRPGRLEHLRLLALGDCAVGADGAAILRKRFGHRVCFFGEAVYRSLPG